MLFHRPGKPSTEPSDPPFQAVASVPLMVRPAVGSGAVRSLRPRPMTTHARHQDRTALIPLSWEDRRNLLFIVAGAILVLLLVPPQHEYPIIDDWNHAISVRTMLDTGQFVLPPTMQANLVGLTVWGVAWSQIFGFSFTTLTFSVLALALAGLMAFYGIARAVGVPGGGALFGTALLAINPIFLHLSYSFMTDVPFISLVLVSCYCYLHGLREPTGQPSLAPAQSDADNGLESNASTRLEPFFWLMLGGLFASWAFLIRQFGAFVPVAFLLYLLLEGLLTKRWRVWQMLGVVLLPALLFGAWHITHIGVPPNEGEAAAAGRRSKFLFKEPWLRVFLLRSLVLLPVTGLSAWAALKIPRPRRWLIIVAVVLVAVGIYATDLPGEAWIEIHEPPFTAHLGPVAIDFPLETNPFNGTGNIVRIDGIDFFEYPQQEPVWSPGGWHALWIVGLALGALLLAKIASSLFDWLRTRCRLRASTSSLSPLVALYLLGGLIFIVSMAALGDLYDRYMVHFLPFVILFVVRGSSKWGRLAWSYSVTALFLIATFSLMLKADNMDHDSARWEAGQWLQLHSGGLHGGYDWDNWVGHRKDDYQFSDVPPDDYRIERAFPYFSRLGGFTTRYVYAQSRKDTPPLPVLPGDE